MYNVNLYWWIITKGSIKDIWNDKKLIIEYEWKYQLIKEYNSIKVFKNDIFYKTIIWDLDSTIESYSRRFYYLNINYEDYRKRTGMKKLIIDFLDISDGIIYMLNYFDLADNDYHDYLWEDILNVYFPNNLQLDISYKYINKQFIVRVIYDDDWSTPKKEISCSWIDSLIKETNKLIKYMKNVNYKL